MRIAVTHALLRPHDALPTLPIATALAAQLRATNLTPRAARLDGFSTPAVWGLGGASVRLRITGAPLADGNSLFCVRSATARSAWLPALGASPGDRPDSAGHSRLGRAELMVMARPVAKASPLRVTCLPDEVLRHLFADGEADVVLIARLKNFAEGLSAGRWLEENLRDLAERATAAVAADATLLDSSASITDLLANTVDIDERTERPPAHDPERGMAEGDPLCGGGVWRSPTRAFAGVQGSFGGPSVGEPEF